VAARPAVPVNLRKRSLLPVVRERQALADALARYMAMLGLERVAQRVPTLSDYIAQRGDTHEPPGSTNASTARSGPSTEAKEAVADHHGADEKP